MNIFRHFRTEIEAVIGDIVAAGDLPADLDLSRLSVEPPRDASHGDIATNAAMILAKPAGRKPREVAGLLTAGLKSRAGVTGVDIAGPGFINLRLGAEFWHARLAEILGAGAEYGQSDVGANQPINVEYVSANPTGPLHLGHVRGAVFGDALAQLLTKAGYKVTKEYYINDAGSQIDTLARSAHLRYREALGEDIGKIPEGLYPGDYLKPVGEAIAAEVGDQWRDAPEAVWLDAIKLKASSMMMDLVREDLAILGIHQDVFFSERSLHESGRIDEMVTLLTEKGVLYEGVLEPPKGKKPDDWEPRPQTLFRSTDFGDDVDRAIMKASGAYTYFAADIGYHHDKIARGFNDMVLVVGADHGGYVKRMKAVVNALSDGAATIDVKLCQMVRLLKDGEPFKMSKRSGSFITLRDVVGEVGRDVTRFIMLTRKNDAQLDFDFTKVTEQSKDNPVFYVQYAHARVHSVMRRAAEAMPDLDLGPDALGKADLSLLEDDGELALIKRMAQWPRVVEAAAAAHEPHRIAFYLYDLASDFHGHWNRGNDDPGLRFILDGDGAKTSARLALIKGVATIIASGLDVLGVEPVTEMT